MKFRKPSAQQSKKIYTFLWTSNRKGAVRSFTVTASWGKALLALFGFLLFVLFAVLFDYAHLLQEERSSRFLKIENQFLKEKFSEIDGKVTSLEKSLERVKAYSAKLKLITGDTENKDLKLSMGIGERNRTLLEEENMSMDQRPADYEYLNEEEGLLSRSLIQGKNEDLLFVEEKFFSSLILRLNRSVEESNLREQNVMDLYSQLLEKQHFIDSTPSLKPARGWFTSGFGYRMDPFTRKPRIHEGLDIAAAPGSPVIAPADGIISYVGYEPGYGKLVAIDHGFGVKTRFAHNSNLYVKLGQKVKKRDLIAAVGNTGRSSGPHLHYEVRIHGLPVDPMNYILDEY